MVSFRPKPLRSVWSKTHYAMRFAIILSWIICICLVLEIVGNSAQSLWGFDTQFLDSLDFGAFQLLHLWLKFLHYEVFNVRGTKPLPACRELFYITWSEVLCQQLFLSFSMFFYSVFYSISKAFESAPLLLMFPMQTGIYRGNVVWIICAIIQKPFTSVRFA